MRQRNPLQGDYAGFSQLIFGPRFWFGLLAVLGHVAWVGPVLYDQSWLCQAAIDVHAPRHSCGEGLG